MIFFTFLCELILFHLITASQHVYSTARIFTVCHHQYRVKITIGVSRAHTALHA